MPSAKPPGAPHDPPDRILIVGSGGREHALCQLFERRAFPDRAAQQTAICHALLGAGIDFVALVDFVAVLKPIAAQAAVPVMRVVTVNSQPGRILVEKHRFYPAVLQWFAEGHVTIAGGVAKVAPDGWAKYPTAGRIRSWA